MQINLASPNAGLEPLATRMARLAQLVIAQRVDVIVAQAALAPNGDDAVALLAPDLTDHRFVARADGMAIVSRLPLENVMSRELMRIADGEDDNQRSALVAKLSGQRVVIVAAHVSWVEAQALDNVAELLAIVADSRDDTLIVGDLNQQPDTSAIAALTEAGFVDSWARLNDADGHSYEIGKLWGRIDYIFERADRPLVSTIEVAATADGETVSDHAALIASIDR